MTAGVDVYRLVYLSNRNDMARAQRMLHAKRLTDPVGFRAVMADLLALAGPRATLLRSRSNAATQWVSWAWWQLKDMVGRGDADAAGVVGVIEMAEAIQPLVWRWHRAVVRSDAARKAAATRRARRVPA